MLLATDEIIILGDAKPEKTNIINKVGQMHIVDIGLNKLLRKNIICHSSVLIKESYVIII